MSEGLLILGACLALGAAVGYAVGWKAGQASERARWGKVRALWPRS